MTQIEGHNKELLSQNNSINTKKRILLIFLFQNFMKVDMKNSKKFILKKYIYKKLLINRKLE